MVLAPISKLNHGHEQDSLQLHKKLDNLSKKPDNCKLNFDKSITPKVYVVSSYRGLQTSDTQFGRSGHEVRESDVVINKPGEKIILVLMAYDPVVWKIKKTFDSNVTGVILAGYHDQVITGLPKTTPILEAIYEKQTSCRYFYKNIKETSQIHYIAKRIEAIVGSKPNQFITSAYNGKFYIGNTSHKSPLMQYSHKTELKQQLKEKGYSIDKIAAKEQGIIQLINQGKLRVASVSDIDNWSSIASRHSNGGKHRMRLGYTYVILGEIQFPRGMFGAHSKSFILNKNVPVPTGEMGHNTIYLMNGGSCMGTLCFR